LAGWTGYRQYHLGFAEAVEMNSLHDDFQQCAQAREEARLAEEAKARAELRDRFAGYALIGLLAAGDHHAYNRDEMAVEAWRQADAMMKARNQ
jgi:hypothetical protein